MKNYVSACFKYIPHVYIQKYAYAICRRANITYYNYGARFFVLCIKKLPKNSTES